MLRFLPSVVAYFRKGESRPYRFLIGLALIWAMDSQANGNEDGPSPNARPKRSLSIIQKVPEPQAELDRRNAEMIKIDVVTAGLESIDQLDTIYTPDSKEWTIARESFRRNHPELPESEKDQGTGK